MDVQVGNRLARRCTDVDSYVKAIWLVDLFNFLTGDFNTSHEFELFLGCRVEPGRDVPFRNDQRMPGADRESVPEPQRQASGVEDSRGLRSAERAVSRAHLIFPRPSSTRVTRSSPSSPALRHAAHRQRDTRVRASRRE